MINLLYLIYTLFFMSAIAALLCIGCVAICFKVYSEIMKEHTIRKRYENQANKPVEKIRTCIYCGETLYNEGAIYGNICGACLHSPEHRDKGKGKQEEVKK